MIRDSTTLYLVSPGAITPVPWINNAPDFSGFTGATLLVLTQAWNDFVISGQTLTIVPDPIPAAVGPTSGITVNNFPETQPVSGEVTVEGIVELGTVSLAALETTTVSGTVELGTASLEALENITVNGTVELGATSLAALETITINGVVELSNESGNILDVNVLNSSLPTGAATGENQVTLSTRIGDLTETAPTSDTASSGLNGRLQRIAQRLTALIGLFPTSLGVKTAANSFAVTLASDGVVSGIASQIGEVQASPTANTILDRLKTIASALVFGQKTKANSLSVTPASDAIFYNSLPTVTSATILSLTTNATGTNYIAFSSQACTALDLVNNTGTTLEYRRGATGVALQIPDKSARLILGITNANQIDVRRTDTSNTPVTLQVEAFVL